MEHNKSYRKVSRGWGHLVTWNGPMMGHLNSFSASGGEIFQKFSKNSNARGLPGGKLKLRFDWYIITVRVVMPSFGKKKFRAQFSKNWGDSKYVYFLNRICSSRFRILSLWYTYIHVEYLVNVVWSGVAFILSALCHDCLWSIWSVLANRSD